MNKGIIMEVKKNYAIALNDHGVMDKIIFKENMKIGQKIFYFEDDIINSTSNRHRYNNFIKTLGSIAAVFLIVFTFFHTMKPQEAYAVVSLDINPSIQIEADNKLNIIKVEGVNDDGKNIDFSDIKDISLESGMQKIKDKLEEKNYLNTNKDVLVGYAFVNNEDNSKYEEDLIGTIDSTFDQQDVVYVKGDKEAVDEAKTKNISLGRYEAALKVEDQGIKNNIDKAPVKEITASIRDNAEDQQWNSEDQKNNTQDPNVNSEVNSDKQVIERPNLDAASDNTESNVDSVKGDKDNTNTNKPEKNNTIIEVQPDSPVQNGSNTNTENSSSGNTGSSTTPPKDNSIDVLPNNGTTPNSTASGKNENASGQVITQDQSKK
ncbi:anti-sigma factor domain-containing protein [Clostridium sp. BL-8]|uniref:anti-sigma-I factor RsgI family protein n=1 Tax=Clostridium sp. BL-8 TaxID=349938 RepID=UPI00098CB006|nr:anti-sigma factor domain-containing protein [Clostridium sp. BL-8]OOM78484.1 anti-sigma-I factor RsgI [Clostridium sp. BL-8]